MTQESGVAPLTPERWKRIETLFHAATEIPVTGREEFLRRNCGADAALFTEIERMLAAYDDERQRLPTDVPDSPPASSDPPVSHAGVRLGEYCIDGEIGHGGMGTVFLAHRADGQFEQRVALKVVSAHLRSEFFKQRFRFERQILAQFNHPNITRLLDGGVSVDGDPYLVMEYVDGCPIHRYCDDHLLSIAERIRLFLDVCSAVEYAHRNLVVHRDLKPGNVFVNTEGVAKLLDFGTAKLQQLLATVDSTTTRFSMMTPRYASPEQLRGESVSTLTDVYSLGVMLYELLTGAWPFGDADSPIAGLERAVRQIEPARPGAVITEEAARLRSESKAKLARLLDGDLRSVLNRALEADPRRRYTSVEQFSEDLRRAVDGKPVLARAQTWPYCVSKFVRRNWLAVSVAAVFVLGLSAATAVAIREAWVARAQAGRAEAITRVLQDVIYSGTPEDVKNRTVLQAMEIARARLDDVKDQPDVELSIRVALGDVYMQNSLLPQAEKELRRAETLARQTHNGEMLATTLLSLANVMFDSAQVRPKFMEALQLARANSTRFPPKLVAGIYSEVGQFLGFEKRSPEVDQLLRDAVRMARDKSVPKTDLEVSLSRRAQYLRYDNRIDEAEPLLREALAIAGANPTVSTDLALEEMGAIGVKRGDLAGAEHYFRQRRDMLMNLAGPDNGTTQDARSRLAALEATMGRVPEALSEMTENMAYSRKAFAPGSLGLWHPLSTLAYILNQAERPAEAWPLAKEALDCLGPTTPSDLRLGQIESEAGVALAKLHRDAEALPYLDDAYRMYMADPGVGADSTRTQRVREYRDRARTGK